MIINILWEFIKILSPWYPYLKSPTVLLSYKLLMTFLPSKINSQNIEMAIDKATKIVFALRSYAYYDCSGQQVCANLIEGLKVILTLYHHQLKPDITLLTPYQELPDFLCHPDELNQVWTNLIHNVIQAMNNQGILEITVFQQDEHACSTNNRLRLWHNSRNSRSHFRACFHN
ncbi:MAG: hypothetical protein HC877_10760 [Thioploca sp.]|nr:hypothetical protein [Thioploca sp.]